jgi:putative tricarboxylic transport membrane protein
MDQRNLISSMIFFLLATFVLILSLGLGIGSLNNPQAGFMPFWTGLLIIVFSIILFGITYRNRAIVVCWADLWRKLSWQKIVMVAVFLAVYVVVLPWAGYLIATCVLMIILFRLNAMKIWTAAFSAVLSVGFSYGLFHFSLKTPLPRGIWGF